MCVHIADTPAYCLDVSVLLPVGKVLCITPGKLHVHITGQSPCMSPLVGDIWVFLRVLFSVFLCFPREIEPYEIRVLKKQVKSQRKFSARILPMCCFLYMRR